MSYQKKDGEKSIANFEKFAVHALKNFCDTAQVITFERQETLLAKAMDFASIDGAIIDNDGWIYFYSSRVQFGTVYESFSIRYERPSGKPTEFDKWLYASKTYSPLPTITIQTYVDSDEQSATVAIAKTIDLIRYCERHNPKSGISPTGEKFYIVPWTELERVKVYRVDKSGLVEAVMLKC